MSHTMLVDQNASWVLFKWSYQDWLMLPAFLTRYWVVASSGKNSAQQAEMQPYTAAMTANIHMCCTATKQPETMPLDTPADEAMSAGICATIELS